VRAASLALLLGLIGSSDVHGQARGQRPARFQPEARADYIDAHASAAHLGVGLSVSAGMYVRLGVVAAAGQAWRDGQAEPAGRIDGIARFVVDPLREFRWAPYAAGGVGALYDDGERWRAVLVGTLGVEGPAFRSVVPALEVGFGGGTRVGVVLRRAMPGRR
jgi:hypothetical protein